MTEFSVQQVATLLKVTPLTVRRWLRSGALVGIACDDRADCRISETAITTFLDTRHRGGVHNRPQRVPIAS
jgi:excisionase family DNA binding protein